MADDNDTAPNAPTEIQLLKQRADLMGITYSNNIGVDALRAKIAAKEAEDDDDETPAEADENEGGEDAIDTNVNDTQAPAPAAPIAAPAQPNPLTETPTATAPVATAPAAPARKLTKAEENLKIRKELHDSQMALVRVRITNLDPKKKDLPGEIFCVGNEYVGTIKKYVPYGEQTDNGYHLPMILYNELNERRFLHIRTVKDKRTGVMRPESRWAKEFAFEVMDPLTQDELDDLKVAQLAAGSMDQFA